jgi:septum formation topological specificity factor MinE
MSTQEDSISLQQKNIDERKEELIQVICRQTELNETEAKEQLEENDYDCMKVLNIYFGIKETKKDHKPASANQMIYGEIRNLMDAGAKKYRMDKERSEYLEKMREQHLQSQKQHQKQHQIEEKSEVIDISNILVKE